MKQTPAPRWLVALAIGMGLALWLILALSPAVHKSKTDLQHVRQSLSSEELTVIFRQAPHLQAQWAAFSSGIILAFLAGCWILFGELTRRRALWGSVPRTAQPDGAPWRLRGVANAVLIFMAVSIWAGVAESLALHRGWLRPDQVTPDMVAGVQTLIVDLMVLGYVIFQRRRLGREPLRDNPWRRRMAHVWLGVRMYVALIPIFAVTLIVLVGLSRLIHVEPPAHPILDSFLETRPGWFLEFLTALAVGVGPVAEEGFFRGLLYPALRVTLPAWPAMALASTGFAMMHFNLFAFLPIFVLGMGLAWAYERTRSLWAPAAIHVLHNGIMLWLVWIVREVVQRAGMGG